MLLDSGAIVSTFANDTLIFRPGGAYNALRGDETATEIFTYSFFDQNGQIQSATVTLTIEGQDDPPILGETLRITEDSATDSMSTQIALEDGASFTIGPIQEPALNAPLEELTRFGSFVITPEGAVTYTLDQVKIDRFGLSEGQTVTDEFLFSVYLEDGTRFDDTIVVFIEGSNDLPTLEIASSRPGGQIDVPGKGAFGSDIAYNAASDIVYTSTNEGQISRFDVTTLQFLSPIIVGNDIGQLELSPDGSRLFAVERSVIMPANGDGDATASFYDIDLDTLSVTTVDLVSSRDGIQDIAAAAGDRLFLVNKTDVFTSELQVYDPATGDITTISPFEANNLMPPPQTILIDAASDGETILLRTPGFNDRYALYDTSSDSIVAASDNETIADQFGVFTNLLQGRGGLAAVATDAGLIAITSGTDLFVVDLSFNPLFFVQELDVLTPFFDGGNLTIRVGEITDLQFADDGSELFLYSRPQSEVFTFDIASRSITNRELTEDLGPFDSRFRQDRDSFIVSQEDDLILVELADGFLIESNQLNNEGGLGPREITATDGNRSVSEVVFDDVDRLDDPFIEISGVDADAFVIEAAQNEFLLDIIELRFVDLPNGAAPSDMDQDGQFEITLEVNSGAGGIISTDLIINLPNSAAEQGQMSQTIAAPTVPYEHMPIEPERAGETTHVATQVGDVVPTNSIDDLFPPIS